MNKKETEKEIEKETPVVDSEAKKAFRKLVEAYKIQSPEKYQIRKAALEDKLNSL